MKYIKYCLQATLCIFIAVTATFAQQTAPGVRESISRLERDIPEYMKIADVPGMSAALIRNGKLVWFKSFGVTNRTTGELVTNRSIFEANSLSKPVFSYAVLTLVDQGKLDLDKPITAYMDSGYYDKLCDDPRLKRITPRMILSNSSGIADSPQDPNKFIIGFDPGTKFKYSPTGFQLLSHMIEKITSMKLEDLMQQTILDPLRMDQSSYIWLSRYDSLRAYRHNWQGVADTGRFKWKRGAACCSLQTNAGDYAKVVIAIMNGELLKKATRDEMLKPQINVDARFAGLFWGLGWGLEKTKQGECFWHWGDSGKSKDYIAANLTTRDAVIFFANSENGLSFAKELLDDGMGGDHPGLDFLGYPHYNDPVIPLLKSILAKGAVVVMEEYKAKRTKKIEEVGMNTAGYKLLAINKLDDAVEVFKQNAIDYPDSYNTWDSLAEAYMDKGDKQSAIKYYKKSLEINPKNDNAIEQLKKLEQ